LLKTSDLDFSNIGRPVFSIRTPNPIETAISDLLYLDTIFKKEYQSFFFHEERISPFFVVFCAKSSFLLPEITLFLSPYLVTLNFTVC